jgi:Na+/proline symporter
MKAVHISMVALIAAISGIAMAIATKNSEALATSILALVAAFLPAVQLALPWFTMAPVQGETPKFEEIPKP